MRNILPIAFVIIVVGIGIYFILRSLNRNVAPNQQAAQNFLRPAEQGKPAPDFTLEDFDDKTYKLADYRGKLVVVNFWASWCPPCTEEMPDFAQVKQEFGDRLEILAINRGEDPEQAKRFAQDLGVLGSYPLLLDPGDKQFKAYKSFGMPTTVFVSKDGKILEHKTGQISADEFRLKVKKYIES